ncbi:MAG TPA: STAS domain-containing protein [Streptosporangiaceae bacterium]
MTISCYLTIRTQHHGQVTVVQLQGELDLSNVASLRQVMDSILEERSPHTLMMDLSRLSFADCSSLPVLVSAHTRLAEQGHKLIIMDTQPLVRRLLAVTGLDTFLHLCDSGAHQDDPEMNPST